MYSRLSNKRVDTLIFSALILIQVHAYLVYTRLLNGGEFWRENTFLKQRFHGFMSNFVDLFHPKINKYNLYICCMNESSYILVTLEVLYTPTILLETTVSCWRDSEWDPSCCRESIFKAEISRILRQFVYIFHPLMNKMEYFIQIYEI